MNLSKTILGFLGDIIDKQLLFNASALSYTTVLLLVPLIALTLWTTNLMLKGYGPQEYDRIIDRMITRVAPQVKLLDEQSQNNDSQSVLPSKQDIRKEIKSFIETFGTGTAGLISLGTLFFLGASLVMTLEHSLDIIWEIEYDRSWWKRLGLYLSFQLLIVIVLVFLIGINTFLQSLSLSGYLSYAAPLQGLMQYVFPFAILVLSLTFVYRVLTNKEVSLIHAFGGGLFGGILLQLNNLLYGLYVYNLASARKFYGSLAILPVILVGLYITWFLILLGALAARHLEQYLKRREQAST
ncbi:MAG: YihY/virulence factor BrkB family protein [bacterium]